MDDKKTRQLAILRMIADDMEKDAAYYDGKEFNGRNVAEYMGKLGAAIATIANTLRDVLNQTND